MSKSTNETSDNVKSDAYNPASRYQERTVVPYLTLFDIERKPRETKNELCRKPIKSLNTLFRCPVCLGYMNKTSIVMECLHRFCSGCIEKCLRLGKKECPSCRVKIPSRRSLRPDKDYDKLLQSMFGDINKLEKYEQDEIETWNKNNMLNNSYAKRRKIEISKQAELRRNGGNRKSPTPMATLSIDPEEKEESKSFDETIPTGIRGLSKSSLVDFVLRKHPQEQDLRRLHRELLRTSNEITIGHLKKFLGQKLSYPSVHHIQVLGKLSDDRVVALDDSLTLEEVETFANESPMILQYKKFTK